MQTPEKTLKITESQLNEMFESFFMERIKQLNITTTVESTGYENEARATTILKYNDMVISKVETENIINSDTNRSYGMY
jgi:hypothetical protein